MKRYDAIVLGTGGIGSAALYEIARRGARVLGIDRFHPPHDRGSSHGQTRVIRQAYFEHPDYVPLLLESYRGWRELEQQWQRTLLHQVGVIEIGPHDGAVVPGVLRAAAEHGLAVEQLSARDIEQRWPGLRVPADSTGVFEPTAGYLLVEECVAAHLHAARCAGAELWLDTQVLAWDADEHGVRLRTDAGGAAADRLIIAAGAWAGRLIAELDMRLTVRRKSLFWFEAASNDYDVGGGFPVFLLELADGVFYGFPKLDGRGVKVAEHSGGRQIDDPLAAERSIDPREQRRIVDVLSRHLPHVSPRVTDHAVCLYTISPDHHFIIDRHPRYRHVVFAAGLSGHGFKFAPALGRALADLALDGGTDAPIAFLSANRFGQ